MNFPKKAIYRREKDRIYFLGDFEDGEEIEFAYHSSKGNTKVEGYAYYRSCRKFKYWNVNLVSIKDLEETI